MPSKPLGYRWPSDAEHLFSVRSIPCSPRRMTSSDTAAGPDRAARATVGGGIASMVDQLGMAAGLAGGAKANASTAQPSNGFDLGRAALAIAAVVLLIGAV